MLSRFLIKRSLLLIDIMHLSLGNLKNDDGNGDENGKKAIRLDWQITTLHVHHVLLYISLPSLRDYKVKVPNFAFCRGMEHQTTTSFVLIHTHCFIFIFVLLESICERESETNTRARRASVERDKELLPPPLPLCAGDK